MARVFLSYSHSDSTAAVALAQKLRAGDADIWIDQWEIDIGDSIVDKINSAISSSDFLIVLLSNASVNSRWVKEEVAAATVRLAETGGILIPVLLEHCEVPPLLAHRRYVNLRDQPDAALAEILEKIHKHDQRKKVLNDTVRETLTTIFANSAMRIHALSNDDEREKQRADLAARYRDLFADLELPANLYQCWFDHCFRCGEIKWNVIEVIGDVCAEGSEETDYATKEEAARWLVGLLKKELL